MPRIPSLFIDQLVHLILRNVLDAETDAFRLRAAECLFRTQKVTIAEKRILLADQETVEMHARSGALGSLGRLLVDAAAPLKRVDLDVLVPENEASYISRSDRYDMVLDLSFASRGVDALCRVLEAWIRHFLGIRVSVQPVGQIRDERWKWHIGLDARASGILDQLYARNTLEDTPDDRLLGLFRMDIEDAAPVREDMTGRPVYLALARDGEDLVRMKPQNLLVNLPLSPAN